ncbi:MAG TPA: hypothetical protein DHW82_01960 [Spirochaetia bacterium]|nr:MAG: hypothetical protein A2Y41_07325 [Spirochaetes bacterium GWB1_36_13]HCL55761.1 hypothetical protein [Spirochaetia bacterium]
MEKIHFFIDGYNLYHSLINKKYSHLKKYKWLDLKSLANNLIMKKTQIVSDIYYFTSYHWDNYKNKIDRHKEYIKALENSGVKVIFGKFKEKTRRCSNCKKDFKTHEEKQTDVNIALHLLNLAYKEEYHGAFILSGDSDLIPAIKNVKKEFSEKKITIILPPFSRSDELKKTADYNIKLNENHLINNQFPEMINKLDGTLIKKPNLW